VEIGGVSNAERILLLLDHKLEHHVELTLYGRAALQLGFPSPNEEFATSKDVDAVLWLGQAEELAAATTFWEVIDGLNGELADQGLYISHFFTEDQVILLPEWRRNRVRIPGSWIHLDLYRLGDADLLLSKLMRDDPIDRVDADFIFQRSGLSRSQVQQILARARVPDVTEIREAFEQSSKRLLAQIGESDG
jgi:hypothetical protein